MRYLTLISYLFVVILFFSSSSLAFKLFSSFYGQSIVIDEMVSVFRVKKPCECKKICIDDANCQVASVVVSKSKLTCLVSNCRTQVQWKDKEGDITWIMNRDPVCDEPFEIVEGIGCLHIPNEAVEYDQVYATCPSNSELYSPTIPEMFESLRSYLLRTRDYTTNGMDNLWLGIHRNESGAYAWRTGGFIAGVDPSYPFQIDQGAYPFGPSDPDTLDSNCVEIVYALGGIYNYALADQPCDERKYPICQLW